MNVDGWSIPKIRSDVRAEILANSVRWWGLWLQGGQWSELYLNYMSAMIQNSAELSKSDPQFRRPTYEVHPMEHSDWAVTTSGFVSKIDGHPFCFSCVSYHLFSQMPKWCLKICAYHFLQYNFYSIVHKLSGELTLCNVRSPKKGSRDKPRFSLKLIDRIFLNNI